MISRTIAKVDNIAEMKTSGGALLTPVSSVGKRRSLVQPSPLSSLIQQISNNLDKAQDMLVPLDEEREDYDSDGLGYGHGQALIKRGSEADAEILERLEDITAQLHDMQNALAVPATPRSVDIRLAEISKRVEVIGKQMTLLQEGPPANSGAESSSGPLARSITSHAPLVAVVAVLVTLMYLYTHPWLEIPFN